MSKIFIFVISLLSGFSLVQADSDVSYGNTIAIYKSNYDGDTITVDIPSFPDIIGKKISVRIWGIDTPEIRGTTSKVKEKARAAKRLVENLCKQATELELKNMRRDKYFRILAEVYINNKNLADILIKNDLAQPYDGGTKSSW